MNANTIILLLLIGLVSGVFGGMLGIGGGVIMIPALVFLFGMSQQTAQGTSLAVMLPPIGLLAVLNYYKAGQLNMKYALIISAAFLIGGYFGSLISLNIPENIMRRLFAVLMIVISIKMFFEK